MYPYINIGPVHLGTFGLLLWLAAVVATVVLHRNFVRNHVDADALSVVAFVVIAGVIGAKTWHELQNIPDLRLSMREIGAPGWGHPFEVVMEFLHWFQAGFAWFGGMLAGIAMLMWQGVEAKPGGLKGWLAGVRMLTLLRLRRRLAMVLGGSGVYLGRWGLWDQDDFAVGSAYEAGCACTYA